MIQIVLLAYTLSSRYVTDVYDIQSHDYLVLYTRAVKNCTIYLIRHGETEWNVEGRMQGHADSPLTQKGLKQARERAESLKHIKFAAFYSSDLLRAKRTAEIIALDHQLTVTTTEMFRERHFGTHEGQLVKDYDAELKALLDKRLQLTDEELDKYELFEGYETDEKVATRFVKILRELATAYLGKTIGVVTHGGALRVLLRRFGYASHTQLRKGSVHNVAYIKIEADGTDFFVKETEGIELGEID